MFMRTQAASNTCTYTCLEWLYIDDDDDNDFLKSQPSKTEGEEQAAATIINTIKSVTTFTANSSTLRPSAGGRQATSILHIILARSLDPAAILAATANAKTTTLRVYTVVHTQPLLVVVTTPGEVADWEMGLHTIYCCCFLL